MSTATTASSLKNAGNALFVKKDYVAAYAKYTEAIVVDSENAVLYANRSACGLAMMRYLDSASDAKKATEIDPSYAKAWGRLAAAQDALQSYTYSVESWRRAIQALPETNLSPTQSTQKKEYNAALKAAMEKLSNFKNTPHTGIMVPNTGQKKLPWQLAQDMLPELRRRQMETMKSSAWVIALAYEDFREGVEKMKKVQKKHVGGNQYMLGGMLGAIELLTSGILRDTRVFHIDDPKWLDYYNMQIQLEVQRSNAWVDDGPAVIMADAQKRQREHGWDDIRPALSVTVRAWIMRAVVASSLTNAHQSAVEFLKRAIEVIETGRSIWKDASKELRGSIFEDSFLRGVHAQYLEIYMHACIADSSSYPLDTIFEEADDLIKETRANPLSKTTPYDPGAISSFCIYPIGLGYSMKGFYHVELAKQTEDKIAEQLHHYSQAAEFYMQAASVYPEDDENHAWYLHCAVANMWKCGKPLSVTLGVLKRIHDAIPKMMRIWVNSSAAKAGRDQALDDDMETLAALLEELDAGKISLDDRIVPQRV